MADYLQSVFSNKDPLRSLHFFMIMSGLLYNFLSDNRRRDLLECWQAVCRIYIVVILAQYNSKLWPAWYLPYFREMPFYVFLLWTLKQSWNELPPETSAFDSKGKFDDKVDHAEFIASKKEDPLKREEPVGWQFTVTDFDMLLATAVAVLTFLNFFYLLLTNALMTVFPCAVFANIYPRMLGEYLEYLGVPQAIIRFIFGASGNNKKDDEKKNFW